MEKDWSWLGNMWHYACLSYLTCLSHLNSSDPCHMDLSKMTLKVAPLPRVASPLALMLA